MDFFSSFQALNKKVINCRLCPRLTEYRESVIPKPTFSEEEYWKRPVPGFGDPDAWLLILGLAPSSHGGNRTGRIFTGDKSGVFLMKALYQHGFANQPTSVGRNDNLHLSGCYITAAVKCVPPKDKPTRQECLNCRPYLENEMHLLTKLTHVLVLGKVALDSFLGLYGHRRPFAHGHKYVIEGLPPIFASYHPSPQNTNTGKLTEQMFGQLLEQIKLQKN